MLKKSRVVIIGRPNVGKSTLFNCLIRKRKALVHDLPGVTRDYNEADCQCIVKGQEYSFQLIDTGGIGSHANLLHQEIRTQTQLALKRADLILFVLDGKTGWTPQDQEILDDLREKEILKRIPVIGVVNKIDHDGEETSVPSFYESGIEKLLSISSEHRRGIDDLELMISEYVEPTRVTPLDGESTPLQRIAVVGKPNVGKSTLVNALVRRKRVMTSDLAGTTVDPIEVPVNLGGKPYLLVDTAGMRRKSKTQKGVEVLSVVQTKKILDRTDLAILVIDGEKGVSEQDQKIGSLIESSGCSSLILVNKWDTQKKTGFTKKKAGQILQKELEFLRYSPILFVSAKKKVGLEGIGKQIQKILKGRDFKIPTPELTRWVRDKLRMDNMSRTKIYFTHQMSRKPPTFLCHTNSPQKVHISVKRAIINGIRAQWGFEGTPIRLNLTKR